MLIDNGVGLNNCSAKLLNQLGYDENCINSSKKITIKAYDEEECKSQGLVVLPIRIGPIERDVTVTQKYNIQYNRHK